MSYCPNCGAPVQGPFCMKCGANLGAQQPPPQQPPQQQWGQPQYGQPQYQQQPPYQQPQYQQPPQPAAAGGLEENVASALCYLLGWLSGVFFLVVEPFNKNKTIRFHAFQSIFFNVGSIVFWIVFNIFTTILHRLLNYSLWFVISALSALVGLAFLGVWVFLMYKAYNRERFKIPVIGDLAEKQA